ncbi:cyanate hydratase [Synechococcus sp. MIT S9503]|uniref:cyanate hydratase n=1 Tax=Synechococcus sp. MIT S9503 TaxID=3082547 RepID=UPI0039A6FF34
MNNFFRTLAALLNRQNHNSSVTSSLVLERLYYADGRHNSSHPQHGCFEGLSLLT